MSQEKTILSPHFFQKDYLITTVIFILLFAGAPILYKGPALAFIFAFLIAIALLFKKKKIEPQQVNRTAPMALAAIFILSLPHFINDAFYPASLDVPFRYLIGGFIFLALQNCKLKLKTLEYAILAGAFSGLILVIYQMIQGAARTEGSIGIIPFGYLAATIATYCYIIFLHNIESNRKLLLICSALAATAALYASITTGTRGAWLGFIAGFPALFIFYLFRIKPKKLKVLSILPVLAMALLLLSPQAQNRLDAGTSDLDRYQSTDTQAAETQTNKVKPKRLSATENPDLTKKELRELRQLRKAKKAKRTKAKPQKLADNSLGIRLELLKLGVKEFLEAPILGLGYNKRSDYRKDLIEKGELSRHIGSNGSGSSHNEIITLISQKGLFGLAIAFIFYWLPISLAGGFKSIKNPTLSSQLLLSTSALYIIYGLSEAPLMGTPHAMIYCLTLLIFYISNKAEKPSKEEPTTTV